MHKQIRIGKAIGLICFCCLMQASTHAQLDSAGMSLSPMPTERSNPSGQPTVEEMQMAPVDGQTVPSYDFSARSSRRDSGQNAASATSNFGEEPPPFDPGVDDNGVPVDGGLTLLLATGLGIGGRALLRRQGLRNKTAH